MITAAAARAALLLSRRSNLPASWAAFEVPFLIASSLALGLIFWLMARTFLSHALRWVADRERTRHWYDEPVYRRSRRGGAAPPVAR